jgi:leucyl aminopeptidase (aminopeptidase T)
MDVYPQLILWNYDATLQRLLPINKIPKTIINAMISADLIFDMAICKVASWFTPLFSKILETGRIMRLRPIEDFLLRVAGPDINVKKVRERGKMVYERFKTAESMKATSPSGTNVTMKVRNSAAYYFKGEVIKAGEETGYPGGMAYVALQRESVNGLIVLDGGSQLLGTISDPIKLTVREDKIVKIEGGKQARQLEQYIKDGNDPNFPYIVNIGLGVNPGAIPSWSSIEFEAVYGGIIWALGREQYFFETKEYQYQRSKGETAKSYFNPTTINATLWIDDELFLKDGEFVRPEMK